MPATSLGERRNEIRRPSSLVVAVVWWSRGYFWWRSSRNAGDDSCSPARSRSPKLRSSRRAAGAGQPAARASSRERSDRAGERLDAALPKCVRGGRQLSLDRAGLTARFRAAGDRSPGSGGYAEAEQRYQEVISRGGGEAASTDGPRVSASADAQLAQGKYDEAMATFKELSTDTNSQLPVDSVLMQLGRAYAARGEEGRSDRAFTRIVEEFPQSLYVSEAKREDGGSLKKS